MAFKKRYGSSRSTVGLKRCKASGCNGILTTEEYNSGYDYHLKCYLELKGKNKL